MKVLLAFDDTSLGGTSRSAVLFARLWAQAGADVSVYAPHPPEPRRLAELGAHSIDLSTSLADLGVPDLVHLHHAAPTRALDAWVSKLVAWAGPETPFLTHNVFGRPLSVSLPEGTVVGVLGDWVAKQYRFQSKARDLEIRSVPNPQDLDFFRSPTCPERDSARHAIGVSADMHVALRVGSPIGDKWSTRTYVQLAAKAEKDSRRRLRLIGAPREIVEAVSDFAHTFATSNYLESDRALRDEYWAADSFVHWSHRGESFGNVILEALGTGLPVIYKSRRLRDNTPFEFRTIPGFHYISRTAQWFELASRPIKDAEPSSESSTNRLHPYSANYVRQILSRIVSDVDQGNYADEAVLNNFRSANPLPILDQLAILVRHNAAASVLKNIRARRMGLRDVG